MFRYYTRFIFLLFLINSLNVLGQVQVGENLEINYDYFSFATSVSISGSGERVIVGGYGMNDWGFRVFDWDGYNWIQVGDNINTEYPAETANYTVSISENGNRIAVGSVVQITSSESGFVKVYDFIDGNWVQVGNTILDEISSVIFGLVLSLSAEGNRIVIGNKFNANSTGSAEVYEFNGIDWIQLGEDIIAIDGAPYFGTSISISPDGKRVGVGSNQNNGSKGLLRVFKYNDSNSWVQLGGDLIGDDFGDGFGVSSALSYDGSRILIGTYENLNGNGYCKVFDYIGLNWVQVGQKIVGENIMDRFGASVSISSDGTRIAVGAPSKDTNSNTTSPGYVKLFDLNNSIWEEVGEKMEGDNIRDEFGERIKLTSDGNTIITGGLTYVYQEIGTEDGYAKVFDLSNLDLSIKNYEPNKISLYPNPTEDILFIKSQQPIETLKIFNLQGQLIKECSFSSSVDVSILSSGIYLIQVKIDGKSITNKFIKN